MIKGIFSRVCMLLTALAAAAVLCPAAFTFSAEAATGTVAPASIYESIAAAGLLPDMVTVEEAEIKDSYGVAVTDLDSFAAAEAKSSLKADTVIIMRAKSKAAVSRIEKALDKVLDDRLENTKKTSSKYKVLELSTVRTNGLYVYLVISQNSSEIEAIVDDAILSGSVAAVSTGSSGDTANTDGCVGDGLVW